MTKIRQKTKNFLLFKSLHSINEIHITQHYDRDATKKILKK